jgi:hypothetical protein
MPSYQELRSQKSRKQKQNKFNNFFKRIKSILSNLPVHIISHISALSLKTNWGINNWKAIKSKKRGKKNHAK